MRRVKIHYRKKNGKRITRTVLALTIAGAVSAALTGCSGNVSQNGNVTIAGVDGTFGPVKIKGEVQYTKPAPTPTPVPVQIEK